MKNFLSCILSVLVLFSVTAQDDLPEFIEVSCNGTVEFMDVKDGAILSFFNENASNPVWADPFVNGILKNPLKGGPQQRVEFSFPKREGVKPEFLDYIYKQGKIFVACSYLKKSTATTVVLYEMELSGKLVNSYDMFEVDNFLGNWLFQVVKGENKLLFSHMNGKQLTYSVFDISNNEFSHTYQTFLPHLAKDYKMVLLANDDLLVVNKHKQNLEILCIKEGLLYNTEVIIDDRFEPVSFDCEVEGDDLYIITHWQYRHLKGPVKISYSRFEVNKPVQTKSYEYTDADYEKMGIEFSDDEFKSLQVELKSEFYVVNDYIFYIAERHSKYYYEQVIFYTFDKKKLELINMDVVLNKTRVYNYSTQKERAYASYLDEGKVAGYYYTTPETWSANNMQDAETIYKDKKGIFVDYTYDERGLKRNNRGKQKILPMTDKVYCKNGRVLALSVKGKKKYWKIIK